MSGTPAKTPEESGPIGSLAPAARSTRWAPGQSGNPKGRPKGSRNRASLLLEHLIEGEGEAVVQALLAAAKGGDVSAARALLDRLVPPRKERPVKVALPELHSAKDARDALAAVAAAVADGEILPGEGEAVVKLVEAYARTAAAAELEERVAALEVRLAGA
jgi:Family of unknown function (DUF5681)